MTPVTGLTGVFILNSDYQEFDMAKRIWQVEKIQFCEHIGQEIKLEAELVYPAENLPEQLPRIVAHRCSNALQCNLMEKSACVMCGTNPNVDPVKN
jgi:hypothetical protein